MGQAPDGGRMAINGTETEKYEDIFVNESRLCNSQLIKVVVKNYFPTIQKERNTGEETAVRSKKQ